MNKPAKTVAIRTVVETDLAEKVQAEADRQERSVSWITREALRAYVNSPKRKAGAA